MANTTNLAIPLVASNQAQKEVTVNTAIATIDAILNTGAVDRALNTPPVSPADGDLYIIGSTPTGDWALNADDIAYYQTTWKFISPNEGMTIWVNDEDVAYTWNGSAWVNSVPNALDDLSDVAITSATTNDVLQYNGTNFVNQNKIDSLSQMGVNTVSDTTNKLSVNSDAVLFNNNGTDSQVKVNKNAVGDTGSHLFQTGFSGRAEFGLIGDDNYQVKVSSDGSTWNQVYVVTSSSGNIDFKQDVNVTGSLTGVDLDGLDGVVLTSPTTGQLLKYNGTNWINDTVSGASSTLDALDDTNLTSPADSDFLVFDGTDWINESGATARTSLGVAIGTDVQAYDAELAAIAGLTSAADKLPYFTGAGTASTADFTTAGRALLDDADASAQRTTLGLGSIATQDSTAVNIDGGNIDGASIGVSTASTGKFTSVTADQGSGIIVGTDVIGDYTKVTLSDTQIKALHTTPITLVSAPGANKIIAPYLFVMWYDYGTVAYASVDGADNFQVGFSGASDISIQETIGFIDQTNDEYRISGIYSPIVINLPAEVNTALDISLGGAVTTGDGTLKIKTYHKIVDLTDF